MNADANPKLDPNLIKIRDTNINRVKRGKLARPIFHAKSYLEYIHRWDVDSLNAELDIFVDHMKSLQVTS